MEGGQRYDINLSSGLNASSNDMLVPVMQPTFLHNWQKYQGKYAASSLRFEHNGWAAGWDVFTLEYDDVVKVHAVDVRKPDKDSVIGVLDPVKEYQLIKQQWNSTVEVENYWWVDDTHILELGTDKFILKRRGSGVDDWNGDEWVKIYEVPRIDILRNARDVHTCTNTFDTPLPGLFLVFEETTRNTVMCRVYSVLDGMKLKGEVSFVIRRHALGTVLNDMSLSGRTAYLNTYADITAGQLITQAEWSNTVIDGRLMIGCHLGKNYDQWTAMFDYNSLACQKVVQGYGYVGINGDLTGGEIPVSFFDAGRGFNDKVDPIKALAKAFNRNNIDDVYKIQDIAQINVVHRQVVGTHDRQWYIDKRVSGIVSHLKYGSGAWHAVVLPITNGYDAVYDSPSYNMSCMGDAFPFAFGLLDLFVDGENGVAALASALFKVISAEYIFMLMPRFTELVYLQQTMGQYAYVHYNSSEVMDKPEPESTAEDNKMDSKRLVDRTPAPTLKDTYSFDKQIVEQEGAVTNNLGAGGVFFGLMLAGSKSLAKAVSDLTMADTVNKQTVFDTGRQFCQNTLENVAELLPMSLLSTGRDISLTSRVVGIKLLDMFYSTSERQEVQAGPGFVEHRFVAQCVAQSSTSCQTEGYTDQMSCCLKGLSESAFKLQQDVEDKVAFWLLEKGAEIAGTGEINLGIINIPVGTIAAEAMLAAGEVIKKLIEKQEAAFELFTKFLNGVVSDGVTTERASSVSRHSFDNEGTHKYGEKSETFMYPCWGVPDGGLDYADEEVCAAIKESSWMLELNNSPKRHNPISILAGELANQIRFNRKDGPRDIYGMGNGKVPFYTAACYGKVNASRLPADMAAIVGAETILPGQAFKNENIGVSDPVFTPSMFQDYIIDKRWELSQCCTYGRVQWVTVKDTKLIDCPPSNMRVNAGFCGVACSYMAAEVRRGLSKKYMRPWAVTPNVLALNCTGYNSVYERRLYHSFDGISCRIVEWTGAPGMNKNKQTYLYSFQINDRFKRSNKCPANELMGNFSGDPVQAVETVDKLFTQVTVSSDERGLEAGFVGEDKDSVRWAVPVFTEQVNTMPAALRTLTAMPLGVVEGVTSLCVELANNQSEYKAPLSVDFTIGKTVYRATDDYICSVTTEKGIDVTNDLVPAIGLKFIGSTPTEAYFYSKATRCYYVFQGGTALTKLDMLERFRDIQRGYWDFVNQEVIFPCLMTFKRLNPEVSDKDTETDNVIVPMMSQNNVSGELPPPITTIFNDRSWFKIVSLPSGLVYQGPNRVIINRDIFVEYMLDGIKSNLGKWKRMNRSRYTDKREYPDVYESVTEDVEGVEGWTHNPFLLVTSPLGMAEYVDCLFEWEIIFCWTPEMELIYGVDNYAVVNICADTMTNGGRLSSEPVHVFLTKELFTNAGACGYFSFRFQSKNGVGNREMLKIWSDQYIGVSQLICEVKQVTERRSSQLTQQLDTQQLEEL